MTRLRDPIPKGRSRRLGAAAVLSFALHGAVAALLAGAALGIATQAVLSEASGEVEMVLSGTRPEGVLESSPIPARPDLNSVLSQQSLAGGGGGGEIDGPETGNGNLAEVLAQADGAALAAGASSTSASGVAAALERTPTGAGVAFAGLTASGEQARTVVYAIDASGPMISSLSDVFAEVNQSVASLLPTQRFGVVLFRDVGEGAGILLFDSELKEANLRNRERLAAWLDRAQAAGRSNPMQGLRAALAMKPQVIFLLSRSIQRTGGGVWDLGPEATLSELDRLNPPIKRADGTTGRGTLIKTIQFQEPDASGIMPAIAQRHGVGKGGPAEGPAHRVLKREELQKR